MSIHQRIDAFRQDVIALMQKNPLETGLVLGLVAGAAAGSLLGLSIGYFALAGGHITAAALPGIMSGTAKLCGLAGSIIGLLKNKSEPALQPVFVNITLQAPR